MSECCDNCRFSCGFVPPSPLPKTTTRKVFFGLFTIADGPSHWEQAAHAIRSKTAAEDVACLRFPHIEQKRKSHWCGEYQPTNPLPGVTEAEGR